MRKPLLTIEEVKDLTRLSRSSIYKFMASGEFPLPIKLGKKAVRWDRDLIEAYLDQNQKKGNG